MSGYILSIWFLIGCSNLIQDNEKIKTLTSPLIIQYDLDLSGLEFIDSFDHTPQIIRSENVGNNEH